MQKNKSLKVKPVRSYKKPIYPSYLDKNPLEYPETIPYPFSKKAINALLAAGILVGIPAIASSDISPTNAATIPSISQDSLVNPFSFDKMGVPFTPSSFGTGLPSRLGEKDAKEIIENIFKEEGLVLEKEYLYDKDGVKVLLDGYNTEMQIGYAWVDYSNMGSGMVHSYSRYYDSNNILGKNPLEDIKDKSFDEIARDINFTLGFGYKKKEKEKKEITKRLAAIENIEEGEAKLEAYGLLYLDVMIFKEKNKGDSFSKAYLDKHLLEDNLKHKAAVLTELSFHQSLQNNTSDQSRNNDNPEIYSIAKKHGEDLLRLKNKEERLSQFSVFIDFLSLGREMRLIRNERPESKNFKSILKIKDRNKFLTAAFQFIDRIDGPKLSLTEAKALASLGQTQKDFIAPISQRDDRFIYNYEFRISEEQQKELIKLEKTLSKKEYRAAVRKAYDEAESFSKLDALKELENQVRRYIEWAKSQ